MQLYTRAEFLKLGAAITGGLGFGRWPGDRSEKARPTCTARSAPGPDLVLLDGRVYTVDVKRPLAEAFAIKNGRFTAVGRTADIRHLISSATQVIDARGMTVLPGFIDAHCHPAESGMREVTEVDLDLARLADVYDALRRQAGKTPPGQWVLGFKYDDTKVRGGRVDRAGLDAAVPDHPVRIDRRGGHVAWYNSRAFGLAGVTRDTTDPPGGKFERDSSGALTGLVAEEAVAVVSKLIPGPTRADRQAGVKRVCDKMTAAGLTSVHDAITTPESVAAYQDANRARELTLRVYMMLFGPAYGSLKAAGVHTGFGDEWIRVGGVKYLADGSVSGRTMRMSRPYVGRPNDYGILRMTQDEIDAAVADAYANGFQIGIHANGDVAIDMVVTAYERELKRAPRQDSRPRIEHCTLVSPDLLGRIAALGAIPTPFATYLHVYGEKWPEYGEDRLRWMFAHRSFLDYGIRVARATDYDAGPFEPLMGIQSMVTRKDTGGRIWGANQRISVDEAIRIYTINGAYASFEEGLKGAITEGKLADFVVLADDPHSVDPDRIKAIEVVRTVAGGRTTHEA